MNSIVDSMPNIIDISETYDVDDDGHGNTLWGIQWVDGSKSDFDIDEMRKYCVLRSNGYPGPHQGKWIRDNTSVVKSCT